MDGSCLSRGKYEVLLPDKKAEINLSSTKCGLESVQAHPEVDLRSTAMYQHLHKNDSSSL